MIFDGEGSILTRTSASRSRGGGGGGISVVSFGTTKSSLTKYSESQHTSTDDAVIISQATAQAAQAAKAILNAGGSELTALKTAKAAAVSALMPQSDEVAGIGSSFLRRRKMKRQAEVVASMALASAMVSCQAGESAVNMNNSKEHWDQDSRQLISGGTHSLTLSSHDTHSSSSSFHQGGKGRSTSGHYPWPNRRPTTAEMISNQLRMLPSLASTFSGGDQNNGDMSRQMSSFSHNSGCGGNHESFFPTPSNVGARNPHGNTHYSHHNHRCHGHGRPQNCSEDVLFAQQAGCGNNMDAEYDDDSSNGDIFSRANIPVDSMLWSFASAFSCGPPSVVRGASRRPAGETRVINESHEEEDEEENSVLHDRDEETTTLSSEHRDDEIDIKSSHSLFVSAEQPSLQHTIEEKINDSTQEPPEVIKLTVPDSESAERNDFSCADSDQILEDLLTNNLSESPIWASATSNSASKRTPQTGQFPAVIATPSRGTIELRLQKTTNSTEELAADKIVIQEYAASKEGENETEEQANENDGNDDDKEEQDENAVAPRKRNRRLSRGLKIRSVLTPMSAAVLQTHLSIPPPPPPPPPPLPVSETTESTHAAEEVPSKGRPSLFRKWRK